VWKHAPDSVWEMLNAGLAILDSMHGRPPDCEQETSASDLMVGAGAEQAEPAEQGVLASDLMVGAGAEQAEPAEQGVLASEVTAESEAE